MKPRIIIILASLLLLATAGMKESHAASISVAISANLTASSITLGICYTPGIGCTPAPSTLYCGPVPNPPPGGGNCGAIVYSINPPFTLVAPPKMTLPNGTTTLFQGWSSNPSALSPSIFATPANLTITAQPAYSPCNVVFAGTYCFTAVYALTPISTTTTCGDPLRLGWTGGTVGCFFGISNIYLLLLVGVPLVVVIPIVATMKPKRASK